MSGYYIACCSGRLRWTVNKSAFNGDVRVCIAMFLVSFVMLCVVCVYFTLDCEERQPRGTVKTHTIHVIQVNFCFIIPYNMYSYIYTVICCIPNSNLWVTIACYTCMLLLCKVLKKNVFITINTKNFFVDLNKISDPKGELAVTGDHASQFNIHFDIVFSLISQNRT